MKKLFKKAISSILAFAIAITAVAQLPLSEGIGLTGTAVMAAAETTIPDGYTPVYTMEDLYNIRNNTSGKYIIMNDIDMSGTAKGGEWDGGNGWTPIPEFRGTIDGAGHRLMNMNIFGSVGTNSGFIGCLRGTVKNIRFINVYVDIISSSSLTYYGTVSGYCNAGNIFNCSVSGYINTNNCETGGICGCHDGATGSSEVNSYISECYNNATINGNDYHTIGGIVAYAGNQGYIKDCYNIGIVKNSDLCGCGGIVGGGWANFSNCVNYTDGRIASSYLSYRVDTSYYPSDSTFGSEAFGTALTASLMQQQSSYEGLDFDNTWYMCPEHNRPELQSLPHETNITEISFASLPDTLIYKQGDEISAAGGILDALYNNGVTEKVKLSKDMLSGYDMSIVGKQTVTVTFCDCTATYQITVLPIEVSDITLSAEELTINRGKTSTLTATVSPNNATDKTVTWTSSDDTVATVDAEGKVTAVKVGTATIKATAGAKSAECVVTVKSPASEITLSDSSISLHSGDTKQLTATLTPEDCTDSVRWTSNNEEAATVDENGLVTAVKPGTAIITAAAQSGVMDICTVTVDAPAKKITFEDEEKTINIGDSVKLNVTVDPDFTTDTLTWSVDDSNICTVDKDGTITGYSKGTATVTVKATSGVSATCKVIVNSPALSITLNKTSAKLEYGSTENLTYELFPLDSNDTVEWTTSDTSICLVNSTGMIKAVAPGTATITATTGSGKTATCTVYVVAPKFSVTVVDGEAYDKDGNKITGPIEAGTYVQLKPVFDSDNEEFSYWYFSGNAVMLPDTTDPSAYFTMPAVNITIEAISNKKLLPPSNVTGLTYGARSADYVSLRWDKNDNASGYIVEYLSGDRFVKLVDKTSGSSVSHKVTELEPGKLYKFRVRAYKIVSGKRIYGEYSDVLKVRTLPTAMTGLTLGARTDNSISLKWDKNESANGAIVEMYSGGEWITIATKTSNSAVSHKITGLKASTAYKFRVRAYINDEEGRIYSVYNVTLNEATAPSTVTNFRNTIAAKTALRFNWDRNTTADGYCIEMVQDGKWVQVTKIESNATIAYAQLKLNPATAYRFRIRAYKQILGKTIYGGYTEISATTKA